MGREGRAGEGLPRLEITSGYALGPETSAAFPTSLETNPNSTTTHPEHSTSHKFCVLH